MIAEIAAVKMAAKEAVETEIKNQIKNLFGNELTDEAKKLILTCPHLINRLAENLDIAIEKISDMRDETLEPIEIRHVEYTLDECGRNQ